MILKKNFWKYFTISLILFTIGILLGFGEKAGWFQSFNIATVKGASALRSSAFNWYFIGVDKWADTAYDIGIGLAIIVILSLLKKWKEPLELLFSLLFAGISIEVLKIFFRIPRPHFSWLVNASSYSYPSGHSVGAIALYGLLAYIVAKSKLPKALSYTLSTLLWIFAASILYDRLYVGVHWGMDVIGGATIGFACFILAVGIVENMKKAKEEKEIQESK
jgi:membrane-associated phospholipid phosphatase